MHGRQRAVRVRVNVARARDVDLGPRPGPPRPAVGAPRGRQESGCEDYKKHKEALHLCRVGSVVAPCDENFLRWDACRYSRGEAGGRGLVYSFLLYFENNKILGKKTDDCFFIGERKSTWVSPAGFLLFCILLPCVLWVLAMSKLVHVEIELNLLNIIDHFF